VGEWFLVEVKWGRDNRAERFETKELSAEEVDGWAKGNSSSKATSRNFRVRLKDMVEHIVVEDLTFLGMQDFNFTKIESNLPKS